MGHRYVRHVNATYRRSGTLWEGRYKANLVADGEHLMRCHRYIELNPLRAGMVTDPRAYPWSSHHALVDGVDDPLVTPRPAYLAMAADPGLRRQCYREFVMAEVNAGEIDAIRQHLQRQHAYGPDRFRRVIEAQLGCAAGPQKIGDRRNRQSQSESRL